MISEITHIYDFPGVYTIKIFNVEGFFNIQFPDSIQEVLSIGKITSCRGMFLNCESFNIPLKIDTAAVTDMSYMFCGCKSFNQPVNFNTDSVKNMSHMFNNCRAFNQPLEINISAVTDMSFMFYGCKKIQVLVLYQCIRGL